MKKTPWQKVHGKFGVNAAQLAKMLGRHRSKVSREIKNKKGLINGRDQELILAAAQAHGVNITPDDLTPDL
jgi:IS30 family transposase